MSYDSWKTQTPPGYEGGRCSWCSDSASPDPCSLACEEAMATHARACRGACGDPECPGRDAPPRLTEDERRVLAECRTRQPAARYPAPVVSGLVARGYLLTGGPAFVKTRTVVATDRGRKACA